MEKPTIEEIEALLDGKEFEIEILPSGEIKAVNPTQFKRFKDTRMKYEIGTRVIDEDGCEGVVVIAYNDGDLCGFENDAAHPNPTIFTKTVSSEKEEA